MGFYISNAQLVILQRELELMQTTVLPSFGDCKLTLHNMIKSMQER
jgi:hypothetical protein